MTASKGDGRDHSIIPENIRRGSRFGRMMTAVLRGETLKEMKEQFSGLDASTYQALCAIRDGTISDGNNMSVARVKNAVDKADRHMQELFALFDEGLTTREVGERAGLTYAYVRDVRTLWGHERGIIDQRRRG